LKTTRIRSPKWQIIMRMPIMLLRKRSKQWRVICKTFSINSRRKIKWCNSTLKAKIDIYKSLKKTIIISKIKLQDKMICNLRSFPRRERSLMKN
jgi:hypothetical protein